MSGKILVGTASWSDPGFIADWYPKNMAAAARLPYYAEHFNLVELNSSFYGIPNCRQVEKWCEQTPDNFVFDVKLHKFLSRHGAAPENLPADLRPKLETTSKNKLQLSPPGEELVAKRFLREIEPFEEAGKLGALLLQLSPSFSPRKHKLKELDHLISLCEGKKLAIELRNRGWVTGEQLAETEEFFRQHKIAWVAVDAPDTEHFMAMPYVGAVTDPDLAYLRCHGRNAEGYIRGRTVAERFNYQYSDKEIYEIISKAETMAEQAREVHIVYNNNASDYAIHSAKKTRERLEKRQLDLVK